MQNERWTRADTVPFICCSPTTPQNGCQEEGTQEPGLYKRICPPSRSITFERLNLSYGTVHISCWLSGVQSRLDIYDWMETSPTLIGAVPPALPPPPGVTPNFVNPESRAGANIALHTTCLTLVTIFFAMRIYTRKFISRWIGWDDCRNSLLSVVEHTHLC